MPVYTVHAPVTGNAGIAATDKFVFVRDGFYVWATLLGVVWLAWHRLWLALIGWIVLMVVIDISGRPVLVFKVEFPRDKVGTFDTELVREWFNAFAINAGVTLHVETLYGENSHHIAESCFKGLARALRAAVAIDPRAAGEVPSTKGQLGG